jgi:hypothetical protein
MFRATCEMKTNLSLANASDNAQVEVPERAVSDCVS